MENLIIIITLVLLIKVIWNPKIDKTPDGDILLWYGHINNRKYIKINIW